MGGFLCKKIVGEFKDGIFLNISEICCKLMLIYYSMEAYFLHFLHILLVYWYLRRITTVYTTKEDEEKDENETKDNEDEEKEFNEETGDEDFDVIVDFVLLIVKFFLHYAFGVYLLTIANEESSGIISIAFIIFALISFSKVIFIQKISILSKFFELIWNFENFTF